MEILQINSSDVKKTHINCLGMKQYNTTLHWVKAGKHECGKIVATYETEKNGKI